MLSSNKNIKFSIIKFEKTLLIQVIDYRIFKPYYQKTNNGLRYVEHMKSSGTILEFDYVIIGGTKNVVVHKYDSNTIRDVEFENYINLFKIISSRV